MAGDPHRVPAPTAHQALARWMARKHLRVSMALLVTLAGGGGLLASVGFLAAGVGAMWLRYPLAALVAYGVFLLGLRSWIGRLQAGWLRRAPSPWHVDPVDLLLPDLPGDSGTSRAPSDFMFGGGRFGGGGAGGSFDAGDVRLADTPASSSVSGGEGTESSVLEALGLDDAWPLLVGAVLAAAIVVTSLYLVWIAPALVAELVLDGVVASVAYRQARRLERWPWLDGGVRRTWIPAVGLIVSLGMVGWAAAWIRPDADSIGDLFRTPPQVMRREASSR